jgi:hypothetical protein
MSYDVRCACGKAHAVSAADAGASLRCGCGGTVEVPALHRLRTAAGEAGVSPAVQIQGMLLQNELPGTRACACCHRDTDHRIRVSVVCERVITVSPHASGSAALLGCFALGLAGLLAGWVAKAGLPPKQHGTDVSFTLPVCVCEVCTLDLTHPAALRTALLNTPIYAALLQQYPAATVRRVD